MVRLSVERTGHVWGEPTYVSLSFVSDGEVFYVVRYTFEWTGDDKLVVIEVREDETDIEDEAYILGSEEELLERIVREVEETLSRYEDVEEVSIAMHRVNAELERMLYNKVADALRD